MHFETMRNQESFGKTYTTGSQVTSHPLGVTVTLLLETKELLELVTESKVQSLGREVTDDVGSVTTPEGKKTLVTVRARKAVADTLVGLGETTLLDL